jgi:hypothetical protein
LICVASFMVGSSPQGKRCLGRMRRLCTRMAKKFVRPPLPFTLGGAFNNLSFCRDIHTIQNLVHLCHHRVV